MTVPGPPVLDIPGAVAAALALRAELGITRTEPLPCVLTTAEDHADLDVVVSRLPDGWSGFYFPRGRRGLIAVNADHAVVRQRFTIAHELGHHVLGHGPAPRVVPLAETPSAVESPAGPSIGEAAAPRQAAGPIDASTELPTPTAPVPARPRRNTDPRERAANAFAAELLCPAPAARAFVEQYAPAGAGDDEPPIAFDLVVRLSCAFGISAGAVLMRLRTAKILPDGPAREALQAQVDAAAHIPRYAALGLAALRDELQAVADTGLARLPQGVSIEVLLAVTDPRRSPETLPPPVRRLRKMLGLDGAVR